MATLQDYKRAFEKHLRLRNLADLQLNFSQKQIAA
jgi:hypothetical protein